MRVTARNEMRELLSANLVAGQNRNQRCGRSRIQLRNGMTFRKRLRRCRRVLGRCLAASLVCTARRLTGLLARRIDENTWPRRKGRWGEDNCHRKQQ